MGERAMKGLPKRQPADGQVRVTRVHEGLAVSVTTHDREETIVMSDYNAARVLCSLCLFLDVPMPKPLLKLGM